MARAPLDDFDQDVFDAHPGTIVLVDADLRIRFLNRAWYRFAADNGGEPQISRHWGIGASLMDAVPGALHDYYRRLFRRALHERSRRGLHPPVHEYECSTPDTFRRYAMNVYALPRAGGLLLVHSLRIESPITDSVGHLPGDAGVNYVDSDGLVRQCACCRRFRSATNADDWHWVRDWVERCPVRASHTLCAVCARQYYSEE